MTKEQSQIEKTEAELLEEHLADKAVAEENKRKIEEAADELRRAEWRRQAEAERKARVARNLPILNRIRDSVNVMCKRKNLVADCVVDQETGKVSVNGYDVAPWFHIDEERTKVSSWRSMENGRLRVVVGSYGDRKSYPQRKDGWHNYDAIADDILVRVIRQKRRDGEDAMRNGNAIAAAVLDKELFPKSNYSTGVIGPSSNKDKPILVTFSVKSQMTADEARRLIAAVRAAGVELHYSEGLKS